MKMLLISCFGLALASLTGGEVRVGNKTCRTSSDSEHSLSDDSFLLQLTQREEIDAMLSEGHIKVSGNQKSGSDKKIKNATDAMNTTTINPLAAATGVTGDSAEDLGALLASLATDSFICLFCFGFFMVMVRYYPNIYAFRATGAWDQTPDAPQTWSPDEKDWFKFAKASYSTTVEEMIDYCGLDCAMFVRFPVFAMEILAGVGIPNLLILSTLYASAGGNNAGDDALSWPAINNVQDGSWIFWVVAIMTWYNVMFIQRRCFQWQRYFIEFRNVFLESMPSPQDCTVLVEGIDDDCCSDAELKKYFQRMYGEQSIKEAFVVKRIPVMESLISEYQSVDQNLHEVEYYISQNPDKQARPHFHIGGGDEQEYYTKEKERLIAALKEEQANIIREAAKPPDQTDIYSTNGFVTFTSRRKCEQAVSCRLRTDEGSFVTSYAPDPDDVIYHDLAMPLVEQESLQLIGWGLISALAIFYMPCCLAISNAANPDQLKKISIFRKMFEAAPSLEDTVAGIAPSLGLTIMASMLPTFLMWIFEGFFYLRANRWAQLELQHFYFWFQFFFILLVTAIGSSLIETAEEIISSPLLIFKVLAEKMPTTSHFYMNYIVLQWTCESMQMMRYINLFKYLMFEGFCEREHARSLSEPEDQDFYGIGSRSARFTTMLLIGIVFGTLAPLTCCFDFVFFALCRLIYGYLIPYAECRKGDNGGVHWVEQVHHVHVGLALYITLMVGICTQRAATYGPAIVASGSYVWWGFSFHKYVTKLHWETLAYEEVVRFQGIEVKKRPTSRPTYHMPQLEPDFIESITIGAGGSSPR